MISSALSMCLMSLHLLNTLPMRHDEYLLSGYEMEHPLSAFLLPAWSWLCQSKVVWDFRCGRSSRGKWVQCRVHHLVVTVVEFGEPLYSTSEVRAAILIPRSSGSDVLHASIPCSGWHAGPSGLDWLLNFLRDPVSPPVSFCHFLSVI